MIPMLLDDFSAAISATTPHTTLVYYPPRRCASTRSFDYPCPCSRCTSLAGFGGNYGGDNSKAESQTTAWPDTDRRLAELQATAAIL